MAKPQKANSYELCIIFGFGLCLFSGKARGQGRRGVKGRRRVKSLQAVEKLTLSKKLIRVFSLYGNMPFN